jgi:hypothetical protein
MYFLRRLHNISLREYYEILVKDIAQINGQWCSFVIEFSLKWILCLYAKIAYEGGDRCIYKMRTECRIKKAEI